MPTEPPQPSPSNNDCHSKWSRRKQAELKKERLNIEMAVRAEIDEDLGSPNPFPLPGSSTGKGAPVISTLKGVGQCFCSTCMSLCLCLTGTKHEKDISTKNFDSRIHLKEFQVS